MPYNPYARRSVKSLPTCRHPGHIQTWPLTFSPNMLNRPMAPPPLNLPFRGPPMYVASIDTDNTSSSETESQAPMPSMNGIETISSLDESRITRRNPQGLRDSAGHRAYGIEQARDTVWDAFGNKSLPPEETSLMIRRLEKRADERIQRTYAAGQALGEVREGAVVLRVGITFMPGADKPQVNRLEQTSATGREPDQKDSLWRVNTAGSLLSIWEVSQNLSIMERDQTSEIAKRARARRLRSDHGSYPNFGKAVQFHGQSYDAVTIDSAEVKIVNDLRDNSQQWDVESTLVEVDGSSVVGLMVNYKHLISRGGPEMTFEQTKSLLETMIEDARRLCTRSPILFRMSTRARIAASKNTRYGVDHGNHYFQTLTTSKGIQQTISLSASYFNSLDPTGTNDKTQRFIRPRFLQMIVLLLSLLNDDDLFEIAEFLETTYGLKADRPSLELLFLKVLPLMSINSNVFIKSMIPAYEGYGLPEPSNDSNHRHYWHHFLHRILQRGYILPGRIPDLGADEDSWIVKWPVDGFKSSVVFNNLQYSGSGPHARCRTFNDIPPIELHPEGEAGEIHVVMNNGDTYSIDADDLERMTCMMPGSYTIQEATQDGRLFDFEVQEVVLNQNAMEAIRILNGLIRTVNELLTSNLTRGSRLMRRMSTRKSSGGLALCDELSGFPRVTSNRAVLGQDVLAVAYKSDGRKITRKDAIRNISRTCHHITAFTDYYQRGLSSISTPAQSQQLRSTLDSIAAQVQQAQSMRHQMESNAELSDEPIAKVLYPGSTNANYIKEWHGYQARKTGDRLHIDGKRSIVSSMVWLSDSIIEVSLEHYPAKYIVSPLGPVEEASRGDEIQEGDIAILCGHYMVVAVKNPPGSQGERELCMTNWLRIESEEQKVVTRRGMNRRIQQLPTTGLSVFC
ncbi:hypothetical protein K402DRAFT_210702 [Aulographum hederae CBS 113979]|uniref:Uncharacterized protein n=1 Tax=Aulographum hederae CBS 113979 TaxID=1176131 RepID=A0A6G1GNA9_9PEZI|nr:hypothetical protein K402DRAFT_210702 [Aulographum hederae CBS 113979]